MVPRRGRRGASVRRRAVEVAAPGPGLRMACTPMELRFLAFLVLPPLDRLRTLRQNLSACDHRSGDVPWLRRKSARLTRGIRVEAIGRVEAPPRSKRGRRKAVRHCRPGGVQASRATDPSHDMGSTSGHDPPPSIPILRHYARRRRPTWRTGRRTTPDATGSPFLIFPPARPRPPTDRARGGGDDVEHPAVA